MKKVFVLVLAFMCMPTVGSAYNVYGTGGTPSSCGTWVKSKGDLDTRNFQMSWVLGFISGASYVGPKLKKTNSAAVEVFMDNYCQKNPLKSIESGAAELHYALVLQK